MSAIPKNSVTDVMTEERLRAHWFGGPQVPFWNYDPAQLTIGLEVEYFIAKVDGEKFTLATKQQYLEVITDLCAKFGYQDRKLKDQPGRISKDTPFGFVAIKPDFAWHILEVALPPRSNLADIRGMLCSVLAEVDFSLQTRGLRRMDLSCLPDFPERLELVQLDRLSGFVPKLKFIDSPEQNLRIFPALIAATHVHVNCGDEKLLAKMPELYAFEAEAQRKFCRAKIFCGRKSDNVRSDLYEAAFGEGYSLRTIPPEVPRSIRDYVSMFNSSPRIFPNDPFFPVRDMSYIRPTRFGTIEFRSACSFLGVEKILEIAQFRRNQVLGVHDISAEVSEVR